ncbi:hypothetical protein ACLOJK_022984 [Asimina triloba]
MPLGSLKTLLPDSDAERLSTMNFGGAHLSVCGCRSWGFWGWESAIATCIAANQRRWVLLLKTARFGRSDAALLADDEGLDFWGCQIY